MVSTIPKFKLSLNRTIHPVGQGAFYSEVFFNEERKDSLFTVVYDCGGRIDKFKEQLKTVNKVGLLFISHFHDDHIKGVELLRESNPGTIVVIPKISPCCFIVDIISNYLWTGLTSCASIRFMMSILPALKSKKTLKSLTLQGDIESGCMTSGGIISVPSGICFHITTPYDWCYDAYYNENDCRRNRELLERLSKILPPLNDVLMSDEDNYLENEWYDSVLFPSLDQLGDKIQEIKKVYSEVFDSSHNSYSMLVYSHSRDNRISNSDCLYTGDAEKSSENERIIHSTKPHYIQVPHHGSDRNHNPNYYFRRQIAFISVGYNNTFHHPGSKTVMDLTRICPYIHVITDCLRTKFKKRFKIL